MNAEAVKAEIANIIEENQKRIRYARQYAAGKAQIAKLSELGIIDLMPAGFRHSDADVVIRAATEKRTATFNAYGEGEDQAASKLYALLNEKPEATEPTVMDLEVSDIIDEKPATPDYEQILDDVAAYDDTRMNAQESDYHIEFLAETSETKTEARTKISAYKTQLERGKAYYDANYRVRVTRRHLEGINHGGNDVPSDALAIRKMTARHLGTHETFRWQYLVKADERDLISISDAADLLYGENTQAARMRVQRLVNDGELDAYTDMSVANPQHRRRVSRRQVEVIKTGE